MQHSVSKAIMMSEHPLAIKVTQKSLDSSKFKLKGLVITHIVRAWTTPEGYLWSAVLKCKFCTTIVVFCPSLMK